MTEKSKEEIQDEEEISAKLLRLSKQVMSIAKKLKSHAKLWRNGYIDNQSNLLENAAKTIEKWSQKEQK